MVATTFDRTYEGLKPAKPLVLGDKKSPFDRTYEGLKPPPGTAPDRSGAAFDRTYEGLKRMFLSKPS